MDVIAAVSDTRRASAEAPMSGQADAPRMPDWERLAL